MRLSAIVSVILFAPAIAAAGETLAPAKRVETMLGEVSVLTRDETRECGIYLYEAKAKDGYKIEVDANCAAAFPVLTKVSAWRAYRSGDISFVAGDGKELLRFRGKGFHYRAVKEVDGVSKLASGQEVAE